MTIISTLDDAAAAGSRIQRLCQLADDLFRNQSVYVDANGNRLQGVDQLDALLETLAIEAGRLSDQLDALTTEVRKGGRDEPK